ncbi:hypothetical protein BOX15_Mlig000265g3 [Macrostomum lignano]|uniref:AMP-dependent synthetase/ligase domain-containing protein n=1 Tax=Macrostomum lignano TaxID=282301 RepID=A0A267GBT6_9PLAT|nr:hypothetical protein BOX15_Mlig000265g3 [Macrostomum lignano]
MSTGLNRLEDKFRLAFAGLGEMLNRSDARRQQQQGAEPVSVLRGPRKPGVGRRDGPISRILEDLVHFNNNLTPTAKDPALWWCPPAAAAGSCVTFGELSQRANFLARCLLRTLRSHGIDVCGGGGGGGAALCVVMPCGPDRLALELAALKLGLPLLGLEQPEDGDFARMLVGLQAALKAAKPVALVAAACAAARLPELRSLAPALALALQFEDLAEAGEALGLSDRDLQDEERPVVVADADSACCAVAIVVESMGGRLVSLTQGQLLAAANWLRDTLPWQCHEVLWIGDSCDSAYWRVHALSALLNGIPLLMCPGCGRWDAWLKLVRAHYATRLVASPSFLTDLLSHTANRPAARAQLASLETVLVIGEPLSPRTADEFYRQLGAGRTLGCLYASVEACGAAAYGIYRCPADVAEVRQLSDSLLALSEAAPNVRLAVTDQRGRPLPAGQLGEIRLLLLNDVDSDDGRDIGSEAAWASALRTGDLGQVPGATGHLLCYGRSDPAALAAVEAAAGIGWQLLAAPGSAGRLLAMAPAPECRRFSTAPLMREISMKFEIKVGVLADCSAVPRRRLWELPDLRAVRQPAFADDDLGGGGSDGGKGGKEAEDSGGSDAWTAATRQLVEAAATPAGGKRPAGGGGLGRLLSCPEPPPQADSRWPAWESHLLHTEATYRMEGPDFAGSVGSFRLLDVGGSGRVAALVEFRVIETGIAGAAADAGEAGFDSAACAAAAKAEQQQQLSPASEELGSVCRVLRVRFPSFAGGGGSGGVRALRFLRLADLAEHLLLHCAQLLGCGLAIRVADDLVTQTLCQELGYRVASTRQPVSMGPNFDAVSNGCFSRAAGIGGSRSSASSRSSSVSSSGGGGGGGGRGRGQAWEAATVSELHAQCRSSAAVLLVRSVPRLTSEEASSQ